MKCGIVAPIVMGATMSKVICTLCGAADSPKEYSKGSLLVEIVLWLCFIVPGLIYTIWRHASKYEGCRSCESKDIVPLHSPMGKRLAQDFHRGEDLRSNTEYLSDAAGQFFRDKFQRK